MSPLRLLCLLALVPGCRLGPDDWDTWKEKRDHDGDTYLPGFAGGPDCDDSDPDVHPDAQELCNGVDDNCDGQVDGPTEAQDVVTWYRDADGDGYGVDSVTRTACDAPEGFASASGDCDDNDRQVHPGADEVIADLVDQDCDGLDSCYSDADGDGYRTSTTVASADADCDDPGEAYANEPTGDCDDDERSIHPNAPETTGDGIDADCDGGEICGLDGDNDGYTASASATVVSSDTDCADDGEAPASAPTGDCNDARYGVNPGATETVADGTDQDCDGKETCYQDGDNDGWRLTSTLTSTDGDCSDYGEALSTDPDGDCDDTDSLVYPGAPEFCGDGVVNDCDGSTDDAIRECLSGTIDLWYADARLTGEESADYAGLVVAGLGEVDDDSADDLLVSAFGSDLAHTDAGAVYVVFGPVPGDMSLADADAVLLGEAADDMAGYAASGAGDTDHDGNADILVGALGNDAAGAESGAVYLVEGPVEGSLDLSAADARLTGSAVGIQAGTAVAGGGDTNRDGYADLLVGGPSSTTGTAWLVLGPVASGSLSGADATLSGEASGDMAGLWVSFAGDVNADGADDILVAAPMNDAGGADAGAVYLLLSPVSGSMNLADADSTFVGEVTLDSAGFSCASAGDLDEDGQDDLIIGAPGDSTSAGMGGAAYLVMAPFSARTDLEDADAKLTGDDTGGYAGFSVAGPGDVDGDGPDDVLVAAPNDTDGGYGAGAAWLVFGPFTGTEPLDDAGTKFMGETADDLVSQVSGAGDVDGDARADLLLGAYAEDTAGTDAGAAYLILSGTAW